MLRLLDRNAEFLSVPLVSDIKDPNVFRREADDRRRLAGLCREGQRVILGAITVLIGDANRIDETNIARTVYGLERDDIVALSQQILRDFDLFLTLRLAAEHEAPDRRVVQRD